MNTNPRPLDYWLLWIVAVAALVLNLYLIYTLLQVRAQAGSVAAQAAVAVGDLRDASFNYQVQVRDSVPVNVEVPISRTVTLPISATVPISTVVQVPVEIPVIGQRVLAVPIRTIIPIQLEQRIPISLTVPVNASIPVEIDIPIAIEIADTPLSGQLEQAQDYLNDAALQLGAPTQVP
jgi:hypothetical protein